MLSVVIFGGDVIHALFALMGLLILAAIVWAVCRKLGAPDYVYNIMWVAGAVLLFLLVAAFFFGSGSVRI